MGEENQNVGVVLGKRLSLGEMARGFTEFAKSEREKKIQEENYDISKDMEKMFTFGLNSPDHGTAKECNKDIRITQVAQGINSFFYGGTKSKEVREDPRGFVNAYLGENKGNDYFTKVIDYIGDDSNELCDPSDFYKSMMRDSDTETDDMQGVDLFNSDQESKDGYSSLENIAGGVVETALGIPKLAVRGGAYAGYGKDLLLGEDGTIAKSNLNKTLNGIDETFEKLTPGDPNSLLRQGVNVATDLGATALAFMIPGLGEEKAIEFSTKASKLAKLIKSIGFDKLEKSMPKLANKIKIFAKGGKLGAEIEAINNALDGEFSTPEEILGGTLFGALTEWGLNTNMAKRISTWLMTDGLMTTSRMRNIVTKIKDTTTNLTPERLSNFMTKYGLTGSRENIKKKAGELYKSTMQIIDSIFAKVGGEFESKATTQAIESLIKRIESTIGEGKTPEVGYEKVLSRLYEIYNSANKYSAPIMEEVKRLVDKEIHAFTAPGAAKQGYEGRVETRKILQKELEEIGKQYGNIEILNNVVQSAYGIMDSVGSKMAGDNFMNVATKAIPVAFGIPAIKDIVKGDWKSLPADMVLPLISSNSRLKTHIGSLSNRMRGTTRDQVSSWLTSEGKNALSNEATEELMNILRGDEGFKTWFKDFLSNYLKNSIIIGEQNLAEGVSDLGETIVSDIHSEEI